MNNRIFTDVYWGIMFVGVGGVLLADNLGYLHIDFSWHRHWPVALIVVGGAMVVRAFTRKPKP